MVLHLSPSSYAGFDDLNMYTNASASFVGAHQMVSFSVADGNGKHVAGHGLPKPEALCNCECKAEANFVFCYNTAATTEGISTFYYNPLDSRWESSALRFFMPGTPGVRGPPSINSSFFATLLLLLLLIIFFLHFSRLGFVSYPLKNVTGVMCHNSRSALHRAR
jgi:hypothetical protein